MLKQSTLILVLIIVALLQLEGCVTLWRVATLHSKDVSGRTELLGDFAIGDVFETKSELFLQNDQDIGKENILVTPKRLGVVGGMQYSGPYSAESYYEDPESWPHVLGVLDQGSRVRVDSMRLVKSPLDAGWTYPVVEILDGPFKGGRANIEDLVRKCEDYDPEKVITCCLDDRLLDRI